MKMTRMSILRMLSFCSVFLCSLGLHAENIEKPRIEVFKAKRELRLYDGNQRIKTYRIALGSNPVPRKLREGDRATPEGSYFISYKNPQSKFHLSLAISYPNAEDAKRGLKSGLISRAEYKAILQAAANQETPPWTTKLGGAVFVHGKGSFPDWTWGCIALNDADIEELYRLVPARTPITIHP
jgi:murein L,D-transpeptidase YafK